MLVDQAAENDIGLIEEFAYRHGGCFDSYLVLEPDRKYFWSKDRKGFVAYVRGLNYLKIAGGLIAAPEHKETLLREFVEYAKRHKLYISFYNILESDLPVFEKFNFQITKWGEEPIVDLTTCTWEGKAYEWVRRQSNYCRRQGLVTVECRPDAMPSVEWDRIVAELHELSAELIETRPQTSDIKFLQSEFDPSNLYRKRIFLARADGGAGRIEAFVVCNPGKNGDFWAFEIYRHRPDAVRGTMPFLMHQTMQVLQKEGVREVSLCLVPGLGCEKKRPGDSFLVRGGMVFANKYLNFLFDTAGMYHFKSRFRPQFEERFTCALPKVTLVGTCVFVHLLGVFQLNPWKLCRNLWQHVRKSSIRTNLSSLEEAGNLRADAKSEPTTHIGTQTGKSGRKQPKSKSRE